MSIIKSAYEKAMERFEHVKADKKALRRKTIIDQGKACCAKFFNSEDIDLKNEISQYEAEEADWFKYGIGEAILGRITLPSSVAAVNFTDSIIKAAVLLSPQPAVVEQLLKQFKQLCDQFLNERTKLAEQLELQVQQLAQQGAAGQSEQQRLAIQQKLLRSAQEQMKQLEEQFQPAVEKVRSNMRQLLGTWIEK